MQFGEAVALLDAGFGGNEDQRRLLAALGQMPVDGVVAQVGGAADEPARERRVAGVEDLRRRGVCQSISLACSAQKASGASMDWRWNSS
jgi:hypothetical protein